MSAKITIQIQTPKKKTTIVSGHFMLIGTINLN